MKTQGQSVDFVIRMLDVGITLPELEKSLGVNLDRHETSRETSRHYAQINAPQSDDWTTGVMLLTRIGPVINELIQKRAIGSATMDIALKFADDMAAVSSRIPAQVAALAGQNLIDIEVSVYLTRSE